MRRFLCTLLESLGPRRLAAGLLLLTTLGTGSPVGADALPILVYHQIRVAEDGPGGYDPNRNFAADWQPNYIQGGAMGFPFPLPEAKAVNDFLVAHPNVAGLQTYHNSGGMILRSPGAESTGEYPLSDVRVYDEIGRTGERILPFYRYLVIWSGLYTVHGGVTDWGNDGLGIISLSNELWNEGHYFTSPELKEQQKDPNSPIAPRVARNFFNDYLEFGDELTEWKEFDHPQFGKVEIGGVMKKTFPTGGMMHVGCPDSKPQVGCARVARRRVAAGGTCRSWSTRIKRLTIQTWPTSFTRRTSPLKELIDARALPPPVVK